MDGDFNVKQYKFEFIKILLWSKKGVSPTIEGEILYDHIKDMFNNLNKTFNTIESNKNSGGHLYIGVTTTNFLKFIYL